MAVKKLGREATLEEILLLFSLGSKHDWGWVVHDFSNDEALLRFVGRIKEEGRERDVVDSDIIRHWMEVKKYKCYLLEDA